MTPAVAFCLIFATWIPALLLLERLLPWGTLGLLIALTTGNSGAILAVILVNHNA